MVRTYKQKAGSRSYKTGYSEDDLKDALWKLQSNCMSLPKASKTYTIPLGMLQNKAISAHSGSVGRPPRLSKECCKKIAKCIDVLADWKVPLSGLEICLLVKEYLDAKRVKHLEFKNNSPGPDWLENFSKKHNFSK